MKNIIAVETEDLFRDYKNRVNEIQYDINNYLDILTSNYQLVNKPKAILWTTSELATQSLSNNIVAGYTNDRFITLTPDYAYWNNFYYNLMFECDNEIISQYIRHVSSKFVLQVLGHEIAYHSDLFLEDWDETTSIWFEEGMVEFLSSYYLLSKEEYKMKLNAEKAAITYYSNKFRNHDLENFSVSTYDEKNNIEIFHYYWKSFVTIDKLVQDNRGDIQSVFKQYLAWYQSDRTMTKSEWFGIGG